jgi:thymidylate synthase
MSDGFPLLTGKKIFFKGTVTELLWFLRGDTNIKYLLDNGCNIWTGDSYKNYLKWLGNNPLTIEEFIEKIRTDSDFAGVYGELGPIYGKQWRSWKSASLEEQWGYGEIKGHPIGGKQYSKFNTNIHIDQIANLISDLKTNPYSRRLMVNAWNVGELDSMVLPPCHFSFQCYSHEENGKRYLSLAWNQRSVDVGLGLPFNIASYGLLLEIIAQEVGMIPYELIGNLGDCHIYNNHIDGIKEQLTRTPYNLPKLIINTEFWNHEYQESGRC